MAAELNASGLFDEEKLKAECISFLLDLQYLCPDSELAKSLAPSCAR